MAHTPRSVKISKSRDYSHFQALQASVDSTFRKLDYHQIQFKRKQSAVQERYIQALLQIKESEKKKRREIIPEGRKKISSDPLKKFLLQIHPLKQENSTHETLRTESSTEELYYQDISTDSITPTPGPEISQAENSHLKEKRRKEAEELLHGEYPELCREYVNGKITMAQLKSRFFSKHRKIRYTCFDDLKEELKNDRILGVEIDDTEGLNRAVNKLKTKCEKFNSDLERIKVITPHENIEEKERIEVRFAFKPFHNKTRNRLGRELMNRASRARNIHKSVEEEPKEQLPKEPSLEPQGSVIIHSKSRTQRPKTTQTARKSISPLPNHSNSFIANIHDLRNPSMKRGGKLSARFMHDYLANVPAKEPFKPMPSVSPEVRKAVTTARTRLNEYKNRKHSRVRYYIFRPNESLQPKWFRLFSYDSKPQDLFDIPDALSVADISKLFVNSKKPSLNLSSFT